MLCAAFRNMIKISSRGLSSPPSEYDSGLGIAQLFLDEKRPIFNIKTIDESTTLNTPFPPTCNCEGFGSSPQCPSDMNQLVEQRLISTVQSAHQWHWRQQWWWWWGGPRMVYVRVWTAC